MSYFRFWRRISILPGLRLNFGKRGVSVSAGVPGAHVTVGKHGTRTAVGLPGSGMSVIEYKRHASADSVTGSQSVYDRLGVEKPETKALYYNPWPATAIWAVVMGIWLAGTPYKITSLECFLVSAIMTVVYVACLAFVSELNRDNRKIAAHNQGIASRVEILNGWLERIENIQSSGKPKFAYFFHENEVQGPLDLGVIMMRILGKVLPPDIQICEAGGEKWEQIPADVIEVLRRSLK